MSTHRCNSKDEAVTFVSPTINNDKAMDDLNASTSEFYPPAEAEYDEIVRNADVFFEKLNQFHSSFGTKLTFPTIGGQTLDLQRLFVEVTSRGGFEKIIGDRKWKEIVSTFNFPATITSGSFVLPVVPVRQSPNAEEELPGGPGTHKSSSSDTVSPNLRPGVTLVGVIDAKFDNGYVVSVNLGSDELKGILYHIPNPNTEVTQTSWNSDISTARRRRRKNSRLERKRDPLKPKQNRNSYNFFFAENYARLKPLYHGRERAISKRIADLWSNLSESEKQVYHEKGVRDKERYRTEMSEYKSAFNT